VCGSGLHGWTGVLDTFFSSYFAILPLYRTAANLPSFLKLPGACVPGSGCSSHRRCESCAWWV